MKDLRDCDCRRGSRGYNCNIDVQPGTQLSAGTKKSGFLGPRTRAGGLRVTDSESVVTWKSRYGGRGKSERL